MKFRLFIVLLSVTNYINAATITYNEASDGDLSQTPGNATYVGGLDVGVNTVSGSSSFSDWDHFRFSVGANQRVNTLSINYNSSFVESQLSKDFLIYRVVGDCLFCTSEFEILGRYSFGYERIIWPFEGSIQYLSSGDSVSTFIGSLTEGDYIINDSGASILSEYINSDAAFDYNWTMEVTAVPIPASVWLMLSGLVGIAAVAKRK